MSMRNKLLISILDQTHLSNRIFKHELVQIEKYPTFYFLQKQTYPIVIQSFYATLK